MVTKKKSAAGTKGRVKMQNLKLNRETIKNLSGTEKKQIKGGALNPTTISQAALSCACAKK